MLSNKNVLLRWRLAVLRFWGPQVDVQALAAQVEAKRRAKEQEKAADYAYAQTLASHVGMLTMSQLGAAERRREWNKDVATLRSTCQGKATTREWDLARPDARKLDVPARLGDDDPRCGAASLQKFAGEDLTKGERELAQMQQCKAWWDEQADMTAQRQQQERIDKQQQAVSARTLDAVQLSMMEQEAAARAALEAQAAADNTMLRVLKSSKLQAQQEAEAAAKQAELAAAAADPWLNEDPQQAASALSPVRVRKDHWKGMSPEQLAAIKQQQAAQLEAKRAAEEAAAAAAAQAVADGRSVQRAVLLQAQAAQLARRQEAAAVAATLREQMAAKAAKDTATNQLYANKVTGDYFSQFGTSHR